MVPGHWRFRNSLLQILTIDHHRHIILQLRSFILCLRCFLLRQSLLLGWRNFGRGLRLDTKALSCGSWAWSALFLFALFIIAKRRFGVYSQVEIRLRGRLPILKHPALLTRHIFLLVSLCFLTTCLFIELIRDLDEGHVSFVSIILERNWCHLLIVGFHILGRVHRLFRMLFSWRSRCVW